MKRFTFILALTMILAGGAFVSTGAETVYTSPLFGPTADSFSCYAANVSGSTIKVTITAFQEDGTVVGGGGGIPLTLSAKHVSAIGFATDSVHSYFCKFSTKDKTKLRGIAILKSAADNRLTATSEAR